MTTNTSRAAAIACLLAAAWAPAWAQSTPAGVWKTIDDASGKEKSLVRIVETNGAYTGKIEKLLDPDSPKDATCKECKDDRKDKPVVGMTIIRNVKANDDKTAYEGGDILDPNNGKVYRVRLRPFDDGKKLEVRGYLGPFYRNQTWLRVE
jgi:uncharacterized protein (DUF2147 family)